MPNFQQMRLKLLAPDIIDATLCGKQGPELALRLLLEGVLVEWVAQRATYSDLSKGLPLTATARELLNSLICVYEHFNHLI